MKYLIIFLVVLVGCEDLVIRLEDPGSTLKPLQANVNLSPEGVGKLFIASTPEGLLVKAEANFINLDGQIYTLGPIDERFRIIEQRISTHPNMISASLDLDAFSLRLALRHREGATKICRYLVSGDGLEIAADVEIGRTLRVLSPPTITLGQFTILPIGACDFTFDPSLLSLAAQDYLSEALKLASTLVFESSPLDLIGLPTGAFSINTPQGGSLKIEKQLNGSGVRIDNEKVTIALDFGLKTSRSSCVPPFQYIPKITQASLGAQGNFDLSFSVSKSLLEDLFSSSVIAGLLCWEGAPVLLNQTKLDEIGLGYLPLTSALQVFFQPASLPEISFLDNGIIHLKWPLVTLDTHAEIFGASQRVVFIAASLELNLTPKIVDGKILFDIESLTIATSDAKSKWNAQLFSSPELDQWTRRLMLLSFEKRFSLDSPLDPLVELKLKSLNANATDYILNYEID